MTLRAEYEGSISVKKAKSTLPYAKELVKVRQEKSKKLTKKFSELLRQEQEKRRANK